jgi:hypothetical protein
VARSSIRCGRGRSSFEQSRECGALPRSLERAW